RLPNLLFAMRRQEVDEFSDTCLLSAWGFVPRNDQAGQNVDSFVFGRGEIPGLVSGHSPWRGATLRMLMLLSKRPTSEAPPSSSSTNPYRARAITSASSKLRR